MIHSRENGSKCARVRVSFDMLPKAVQRGGRDKQLEVMKKMFKRACNAYGIFHEMKERQFYVKPGEKRRRAKKLAKAAARGEVKDASQRDEKDTRYFDEYNY